MEFILKFGLVNYFFYAFNRVLISKNSEKIGTNGRIRENFDKNRQIKVPSIVIVSGHSFEILRNKWRRWI